MAERKDVTWQNLAESTEHLTPELVLALDRLIERSVAQGVGYFQIWCYVQIEKGIVRQVGVCPIPGVSVRIPDGGRHRPER